MTKPIVIHRDGTFEYKGGHYRVVQGSDTPTQDGSRYIIRYDSDTPGDYHEVEDGLGYMREVRAFLARAQAKDWPDLEPDEGPESGK